MTVTVVKLQKGNLRHFIMLQKGLPARAIAALQKQNFKNSCMINIVHIAKLFMLLNVKSYCELRANAGD